MHIYISPICLTKTSLHETLLTTFTTTHIANNCII